MKKILNWILKHNYEYFEHEIKSQWTEKNLTEIRKADLAEIYENNKYFFELLLIKDFVGHVPKEISEPNLKIFEDHAEMFEKWILWQSYYINKRAINDSGKIHFYNGMMVYLKVLHTMAKINKKVQINAPREPEKVEEKSSIEKALEDVKFFKDETSKKDNKKDTKKK